jgi:hypothetical protein
MFSVNPSDESCKRKNNINATNINVLRKIHIKDNIIRLHFILFIYYIDLIVIFRWEMYLILIKSDDNLIKNINESDGKI